ncbi:MAG: hypothetical protein WD512_17670 [Candidatus Paceibacterota bacterium]
MLQINIKGDVYNNKFAINHHKRNKKKLLDELSTLLINLQSDKHIFKTEPEKNHQLKVLLQISGLLVDEEAKQGRSGSDKNNNYELGNLDIVVFDSENKRKMLSIIEAFELNSLGPKNTIVKPHINKLLQNYDTAGNKENYAVIYAKAKNFDRLWKKYFNYVNNEIFPNESNMKEIEMEKSDLRGGTSLYKRNGKTLSLHHLFVNMYLE